MATITYIPNDPLASGGPPTRTVRPTNFPRGDSARCDVQPAASAGAYEVHTPEFDYWQARTALVSGIRAWRDVDGSYLRRWFGNQRSLTVLTNAGDDLNAFYDRASLQFFAHTFDGVTVHSAESVDVVAHELGHAVLDAIRPDFFDVPFIEVGALHEAFGDCLAILTALSDDAVRAAALAASADLASPQFLESLAEELGDAIFREFGPEATENGALRHALNTWSWVDPTTLPPVAPADQLAGEVHSFARVFAGAFYDTLRNAYAAGPSGPKGLQRSARTVGRLLLVALRAVPATPRTLEGVGRRMVQADIAANGGANVEAIRTGFAAHGMEIGAASASLEEPLGGGAREARRRLRGRLAAPEGARLEETPVDSELHGPIAHVAVYQPMALTGEGLEGTNILVPAVARVTRRGRALRGVVGAPQPVSPDVEREARALARSLAASGSIALPPATERRLRGRRAIAITPSPRRLLPYRPTHEVRIVQGEPTIVRRGFA